MRSNLFAIGATVGAAACALVACVGDSTPPPVDAGVDQTAGDAAADVAVADATTDGAADAGIACKPQAPQLFAPVPDAGPFCSGAGPGNHCAFGQHCCTNPQANTRVCAPACDAGTIDIQCFSKAECASNLTCCGNGTPNTADCPYAVIQNFTGTVCASSCSSSEFVECAASAECSGKTCTPAYDLDPTQTATGPIQVGACL